jgi:hypothetical protein
MLHLELYGQGELHASLIVPSIKKTYLVHCELAQHAEKGMKSQLKVEGGDGDLSSISGISVAINTDDYMLDWSFLKLGGLVICIVILMIIYFGNKLFLKAFCYSR